MPVSRQVFFSAKFIKQILILTAMMSIAFTLRHHKQEPNQFLNFTGSGMTQQMKSTYMNKINDAYSFYGNDTKKTTEYLAKQFENKYGWLYSVIILTTNQYIGYWVLVTLNPYKHVTWTNVNTYQPEWRYFIWPILDNGNRVPSFYDGIGKGSGVSQQKIAVIRNIIRAQEQKYSQCMCFDSDLITLDQKLEQFDNNTNQQWTIICKKYSESYFNGYLQSVNYEFIQIHANEDKCEYLFVRQL